MYITCAGLFFLVSCVCVCFRCCCLKYYVRFFDIFPFSAQTHTNTHWHTVVVDFVYCENTQAVPHQYHEINNNLFVQKKIAHRIGLKRKLCCSPSISSGKWFVSKCKRMSMIAIWWKLMRKQWISVCVYFAIDQQIQQMFRDHEKTSVIFPGKGTFHTYIETSLWKVSSNT